MESSHHNPIINVHNPAGGCRLVRSPSRDSLATQASLGSVLDSGQAGAKLRVVSFRAKSDCETGGGGGGQSRGPSPSPLPSHRLSVPHHHRSRPSSADPSTPWLDEGNDLIRSCGALSKVLGLQRSFSCGDIQDLELPASLQQSRSDSWLLHCEDYAWGRLDPSSRSLSTWVAVGDVEEVNSQLPSPHVEMCKGFPPSEPGNQLSPADLIRSVNKKVRHNYIRRRLKVTYKALEQLSETGFDLVKVEAAVRKTRHSQNLETLLAAPRPNSRPPSTCQIESVARDLAGKDAKLKKVGVVSQKDIAKDQGKPISKYERNMLIFDWLHTLDESATANTSHELQGQTETGLDLPES